MVYLCIYGLLLVRRELLEFLGVSRLSQTDDIDANQLIALLKMKDEELQSLLSKGLIAWLEHMHQQQL